MATPAQIQAAITSAQENEVSDADMAKLLKVAIVNSLIDGSGSVLLPWQVVTSDGTTYQRIPLEAAQRLYNFFHSASQGGVVPQYSEFTR